MEESQKKKNDNEKKDKRTNNDIHEEFEDTNGVIRLRKLKKNRQHNGRKKQGQKDKQRSTKHYTESKRSSNTNPLRTETYVLYLIHFVVIMVTVFGITSISAIYCLSIQHKIV